MKTADLKIKIAQLIETFCDESGVEIKEIRLDWSYMFNDGRRIVRVNLGFQDHPEELSR